MLKYVHALLGLEFPSILKVYLEHVCVTGITFHYVGYETQGLCKAKKAVYISTAGGFVGAHHLGQGYIRPCSKPCSAFRNSIPSAVKG